MKSTPSSLHARRVRAVAAQIFPIWLLCGILCGVPFLCPLTASAQGTAFTHQGRLDVGGSPATGAYDFQFLVYGAASGGAAVAGPNVLSSVAVSGGLFTVRLDFGSSVFTGPGRWLEMSVRPAGGGAYTTLSPRQELTPSPYAIFAANAATANSVAANSVGTANLVTGAVTSATIADGTIVAGDLSAGLLGNTFWRLIGNAGTTPGVNFLGTTDNQSVEIRVNNRRMLRLEPAFNVIGGQDENQVSAGVSLATIAGGEENMISASRSVISGGSANSIRGGAVGGVIGGGDGNTVGLNAAYSVISGGLQNSNLAPRSVIGGGGAHYIALNDKAGQAIVGATVGGGYGNVVLNTDATTSGGSFSENSGRFGVIGGGTRNTNSTENGTVGGGAYNILNAPVSATIAGGYGNRNSGWDATIGGGSFNSIQTNGAYSTISGGSGNTVQTNCHFNSIAGGAGNSIQTFYFIDPLGEFSSTNESHFSTIAGGEFNTISRADWAFAAGRRAKVSHDGSFLWADSQNTDFSSGRVNEFAIRAAGGVRIQSDRGIVLSATDTPLITRDFDPFDVTAPAAKAGRGRWGLFMEPSTLVLGMPSLGFKSISFGKYAANGTFTSLAHVEQDGTFRTAGAVNPPSDRNVKQDFAPVDSRMMLERVSALPLQTWTYTNNPAVRHIGPVAQDFHAAFGFGSDDKHIATVDADGVALAAIQGLNQKVEDQRRQMAAKDDRVTALENTVKQLQGTLEELVRGQIGHARRVP